MAGIPICRGGLLLGFLPLLFWARPRLPVLPLLLLALELLPLLAVRLLLLR